jgi:hypothetical protein
LALTRPNRLTARRHFDGGLFFSSSRTYRRDADIAAAHVETVIVQITAKTRFVYIRVDGNVPEGRPMTTLDEAIAREFSRARLQKRRWQRVLDELGAHHGPDKNDLITMVKAFGAASAIEYRQSKRRLFDVLDLMTSAILPSEGTKMTSGERAKLLSRINYHDRLAKDALEKEGDAVHADTHRHISATLRGSLNHTPTDTPDPEPSKKPSIKRSYL